MTENIRVCHVVNSVGDTSMPGDLATTQASLDEFEKVGILAWFDVAPFQNMERVETASLDVPDTLFINPSKYTMTKNILSGYDIIHTHHPHSGFYGKLIAKRLGKPVIHTEHNNHNGFTRKGRIANTITNVLADAVVCVSESVRESFLNWEATIVKGEKVSVINNGVDIERLERARDIGWSIYDVADIDPGATVVGSAGSLTEQKAHNVLIEAIDYANSESDQPIELVISGDGDLRERLESQIKNLKYSNRIHLLGFLEEREEVHKMMHEIDIYAMPSRWEGFCVAALEAMAVGNACVLSDIEAFTRPFSDVALFHPIDDAATLANRLLELAADNKKHERYREAAHDLVHRKYTLRRTADRYIQAYRDCLPSE